MDDLENIAMDEPLKRRQSSRLSRNPSMMGPSNMQLPVFGKKASIASFNASKAFNYTEDDPELFR